MVDRNGRAIGLVTMKDLVEELGGGFGELVRAYDGDTGRHEAVLPTIQVEENAAGDAHHPSWRSFDM